jgi:hypothetical protein
LIVKRRPANRWPAFYWGKAGGEPVPDKAMTPPRLGREAVSVCTTSRDELKSRAAAAG